MLRERWFNGFNEAARGHILGSIPMLVEAAEGCDPDSVVIQAGGCHGLYPWILAEFFDRVLTFEPDAANFRVLMENSQGCRRITATRMGLGAQFGRAALKRFEGNPGGSQLYHGGLDRVVTVQGDDAVLNLEVGDRIGMIQLDVEGAELDALKGLEQTIKRCRPVIMYEHCHDHLGAVDKYLRSLGYAEQVRGEHDAVWR